MSRALENFDVWVRIRLWLIKEGFQEEVLRFQGTLKAQLLSFFHHHLNS